MCGRYYFDIDEKELQEIIEEVQSNLNKKDYKTGEIYPTNIAPIITKQGIALAKWGFPKWDNKGVVINARAEGISDKRMFKNLVNSNRCIIPASAYYEWNNKNKYIFKKDDSILYMGGLYNNFYDKKYEQLSIFDANNKDYTAFTIITKEANSYVSNIHDRMPLIFTKEEMQAWLHGEDLKYLLNNNDACLEYSIS